LFQVLVPSSFQKGLRSGLDGLVSRTGLGMATTLPPLQLGLYYFLSYPESGWDRPPRLLASCHVLTLVLLPIACHCSRVIAQRNPRIAQ
jgi:hypothetical protein